MKYKIVKYECYTHEEMLLAYEQHYENDYQLIGYEFNLLEHKGELVLYPRKEEEL